MPDQGTVAVHDMAALRLEMAQCGKGDLKDDALARVLGKVGGDVDLAACAITMEPQPAWVADTLGGPA